MTSMRERIARTICTKGGAGFCRDVGDALGCKCGRGETPHWSKCIATLDQLLLSGNMDTADAVLAELREPDPRMIAATLPLISEPTYEQRELGKRALALLPPVRVEQHYKGEIAAAEVVRDWQNMIDHARSDSEERK